MKEIETVSPVIEFFNDTSPSKVINKSPLIGSVLNQKSVPLTDATEVLTFG